MDAEEYRSYCKEFRSVERYLRSKSVDTRTVNYNICKLRRYDENQMSGILEEAGFLFIKDDSVYEPLEGNVPDELGLFKNGKFLLRGRFIFPVRDMLGNTIAMIGWFPDEKKYVTTPSKLFSKSCLFYGMEQLGMHGLGGNYYLCEGIFDTLSVRSLGIRAIGNMGITYSRVKGELYSIFGKLIGVPDNDTQGRSVLSGDKWKLRSTDKYLRWIGEEAVGIKDIDDLIREYEPGEIRDCLLSSFNSSDRVVNIEL